MCSLKARTVNNVNGGAISRGLVFYEQLLQVEKGPLLVGFLSNLNLKI